MLSAGDFRNGMTIELENNIYQIIEFQHVKPGKGAAFVRTKLKNIKSGGVVEKTFRPTEKFPQAQVLTVKICSICTVMGIYTISWIWRLMNRLH